MGVTGTALPIGVVARSLEPHSDERGDFLELWRIDWPVMPIAQWNVVRSRAGVLRGVHVHRDHDDYLTVPFGKAVIGLRDLRRGSPSFGRAALVELGEQSPMALMIPRGVAHGFLFLEPSVHCYGVTRTFDPADELGCRFDDPMLGIDWPRTDVLLSPRDQRLPTLQILLEQLDQHGTSSTECSPVPSEGE